jgi:hypothetical protein
MAVVCTPLHSKFVFDCSLSFCRIFILEGLVTVVFSVLAYWIVPTWSHKARWVSLSCYIVFKRLILYQLTEEERARLLARLAADSDAAVKEQFSWVYVRQALTDHLVWGYALLFHGFAFVLYTLSLFLVSGCFVKLYLLFSQATMA